MNRSKTTTDHDEIRRWAEARGGKPSAVKGTSRTKNDVGMIRIDFPGYSGAGKLAPISWDEWFEKFDESNLAMILQEETAKGQPSNFNKLVARESPSQAESGKGAPAKPKSRSTRAPRESATKRSPSRARPTKQKSSPRSRSKSRKDQ